MFAQRIAPIVAGLSLVFGLPSIASDSPPDVRLEVLPLVDAEKAGGGFLYRDLSDLKPDQLAVDQAFSMLGREDLAAQETDEYELKPCGPLEGLMTGEDAVLTRIIADAKSHRVVIINESHTVTSHRDFSRKVIAALRPHGFTTLAAETFSNLENEPDPVDIHADSSFIHSELGWYSREPVFGALLTEAKRLGYRFVAYEQFLDANRRSNQSSEDAIADRERAQAENIAAILDILPSDEKLIVHVGYWHANERETRDKDGVDRSMMASRLKRGSGYDPLTIAQTECRGNSSAIRLSAPPVNIGASFDLYVDHPLVSFRYGRPEYRFEGDYRAVPIPEPYASSDEPLIVEAFLEGQPFDAVPIDRVWKEPGEDVKLALKPGTYYLRAVIPAKTR